MTTQLKKWLAALLTHSIAGFWLAASSMALADVEVDKINADYWGRLGTYAITPEYMGFGDSYDPSSGGVTFRQVDVSLPGNFDIPVEFARSFDHNDNAFEASWSNSLSAFPVADQTRTNPWKGQLGYWTIDLPHIQTKHVRRLDIPFYSTGYVQLCTQATEGAVLESRDANGALNGPPSMMPWAIASGSMLVIPGEVNEPFLVSVSNSGDYASDYSSYTYTESNYKMDCVNTAGVPGAGEIFRVSAPDGKTYFFTQRVDRVTGSSVSSGQTSATYGLEFIEIRVYVTRIEDRFGNYVNFNYGGGSLTGIVASDGREISIEYKSLPGRVPTLIDGDSGEYVEWHYENIQVVDTVTANGRTWTYQYGDDYDLTRVVLPNGDDWVFDSSMYLLRSTRALTDRAGFGSCGYEAAPPLQYSMTNPQGAQASFRVGLTYHGIADQSTWTSTRTLWGVSNYFTYSGRPKCYVSLALEEKVISGAGFDNEVWKYYYSENPGNLSEVDAEPYTQTRYSYEGRPGYVDVPRPSVIDDPVHFKFAVEEKPSGAKTVFYIDRKAFSDTEGKVVAVDTINGDGALVRRVEYEFEEESRAVGMNGYLSAYGVGTNSVHRVPLVKETTTLYHDTGSDTYSITYSDFNSFGIPRKEVETGPSGHRYTLKTYTTDSANWVVNLPRELKVSDWDGGYKTVSETTYATFTDSLWPTSSNLLPASRYSFGFKILEFTDYHSDGNVARIEFNAPLSFPESSGNRFVEYSNYKAGVAQSITLPERYSNQTFTVSRTVDDNGWLTSVQNFNGVTTTYTYDDIGRLQSSVLANDITYGNNWWDTLYSWSFNSTGQPRLLIEQCRLTTDRQDCSGAVAFWTTKTFDNKMRLLLEKTFDPSGGTNGTLYQRFEYNTDNLMTFQSSISRSSAEVLGATYDYDDLGRLLSNSRSGWGTVTKEYLDQNRIRVTDAESNQTTTTYVAYRRPNYSQASKIASPEGVTTTLDIDVFGNIKTITQTGPGKDSSADISQTETRLYNANMQLCGSIRDDTGGKAYGYNTLGEISWQAEGATYDPANPVCLASSPVAVTFLRDNRGDIHRIDYPDAASSDVDYRYDRNGNLLMTNAGDDVAQKYTYNNQNKLVSETLEIYGLNLERRYQVAYGYNNLLARTYTQYPDGTRVFYKPNGRGWPTEAQSYTSNTLGNPVDESFAHDVSYHATGALDSFTYGNGTIRQQVLDPIRYVPTALTDTLGSVPVVDFTYTYDNNANVTSILDGINAGYSLTSLSYDGLDRLTGTTGGSLIGSSTIQYDGLGNITDYQSKGRTLDYAYDYAGSKRLVSVSGVSGKYDSIGYDDRGNVTHNGQRGFTFNRANQLIASGTNQYVYDSANRRMKRTNGDGIEYSFYSQGGSLMFRESKVQSITTAGEQVNYIYLGNKLIAKAGYFTGTSSTRQHYRPFGETLETKRDGVGYTGHKYDADIGLNYMQARYYDPVIGRFYSNDPVGYISANPVMSFNRYLYVNNNPYRYTDPSGQVLDTVVDVGFVLVDIGLLIHDEVANGGANRATNLVALGADVGSAIVPFASGGGLAVRAGRAVDNVADVADSAASQLAKNKAAGDAFEKQVMGQLQQTQSGVAQQITVKTQSGTRTRIDLMGRDANGNIICTECKASVTAPLTANQRAAFPEIQQSGAVVVGNGKPGFPGGTQIPPTKVDIVRP